MTDRERLLDELRPVAFAIAYRMLGSVSKAEDVVQEALLRVHQALQAGEEIASPRASLLQSKVHDPLRLVEGKEINGYREDNRTDARGTAEKGPGNYFWGGPSVHANFAWWVCSVKCSRTSSYDSDHIAADFQGPESTPKYGLTRYSRKVEEWA